MVIWGYFTHFHESALCYTDVHVYRATSLYSIPNVDAAPQFLQELSLLFAVKESL